MLSDANNGWIKLHRKVLENPIVMKDSEHFQVWIYLLLNASHAEYPVLFDGKRTLLKPGDLITGRKKIAIDTGIHESKVRRILKTFEIDQQIDQQTTTRNTLISIKNWDKYQISEQQNEQQVNNNRPTTDQQLTTNKKIKKVNNVNKIKNNTRESTDYQQIIDLYHSLCPSYPLIRSLSDARKKAIKARLNQYSVDDFRTLFEKAEASAFLKGSNNRNWSANFDWLIKDANMAKVLDGNYDRKDAMKNGNSRTDSGQNPIFENLPQYGTFV